MIHSSTANVGERIEELFRCGQVWSARMLYLKNLRALDIAERRKLQGLYLAYVLDRDAILSGHFYPRDDSMALSLTRVSLILTDKSNDSYTEIEKLSLNQKHGIYLHEHPEFRLENCECLIVEQWMRNWGVFRVEDINNVKVSSWELSLMYLYAIRNSDSDDCERIQALHNELFPDSDFCKAMKLIESSPVPRSSMDLLKCLSPLSYSSTFMPMLAPHLRKKNGLGIMIMLYAMRILGALRVNLYNPANYLR